MHGHYPWDTTSWRTYYTRRLSLWSYRASSGVCSTHIALAWVAAGFLYELGVTLEWPEVQFLARLGGWVPRQDRRPGKIVMLRGLRRLIDMLTTKTMVDRYIAEHSALPPRIAALIGYPTSAQL